MTGAFHKVFMSYLNPELPPIFNFFPEAIVQLLLCVRDQLSPKTIQCLVNVY